jgi:alpha-amylase
MLNHMLRRTCVLLVLVVPQLALGQGGYNDDRVMIQGFMQESHRDDWLTVNGYPFHKLDWKEKWYAHVASKVQELSDAEFDLIWLPPPSDGDGAGYHPRRLNEFDNNYGTLDEHKAVLKSLLDKGIEPIADVVINHRVGTAGWGKFTDPEWSSSFICSDDEFWSVPLNADGFNDDDRAIRQANQKGGPDFALNPEAKWDGARDLDHASEQLRAEIKKYLERVKALGYRGWRYDMVKGYDAKYVAEYNFASAPTFAVGEFWDEGNPFILAAWVDGTRMSGQPDPALKASGAFDFVTYRLLKDYINNGKYAQLAAISFKDGVDDGLIAINRDKAVTFLENHDTGFPKKQLDSFPNDERLMQAYAFILTHPGVPCVYWKHYFEWKRGDEIRKLIKARKYAGVHSGSFIKTEVHGSEYVAIVGDKPQESSTLIVKIGHGLAFNPDPAVWELETFGNGYAVWVRKTKKAETQERVDEPKDPLPSPP